MDFVPVHFTHSNNYILFLKKFGSIYYAIEFAPFRFI